MKILIIDDCAVARNALVLSLTELGHDVTANKDGVNFLCSLDYYIKKKGFDLILLDIGLPGINGIQLAKIIRVVEATHHIIIAITASKEPPLLHKRPFDEVYEKPLSARDLKRILRNRVHDPINDKTSSDRVRYVCPTCASEN